MGITKEDREALQRWKNYLAEYPADGPVFLDIALRAVAAHDELKVDNINLAALLEKARSELEKGERRCEQSLPRQNPNGTQAPAWDPGGLEMRQLDEAAHAACRNAFEEWHRSTEPSEETKRFLESGILGQRWDSDKESLWRMWQAAWNAHPAREVHGDFEAALSASPTPPTVLETYRRVADYLRTIPAYHIPRSYLTHHADPMGRGKDEMAISVALYLNDTSDASLPPQTRFDAVTIKFMLVEGRFVRTTPKALPEMSEEAMEVVRGIEAIVCKEAA